MRSPRATTVNFSVRKSRKASTELSTKPNTQATRIAEQLKTGPDRARQNIMNNHRQRRYREVSELRKSPQWGNMTEEQRQSAETEIVNRINKARDTAINEMFAEWHGLVAAITESEAHLPRVDSAPDTESDMSDPEFEEDDDEAAKSAVPIQRDEKGRFQPDPTTSSDLMDIWNRNVKVFKARTDVLETLGRPDEEGWLRLEEVGSTGSDDESDEMDEVEEMDDGNE
jgi:hypothetical protein